VSGDTDTAGDGGLIWTVINGIFPSNCYLHGTGIAGECFIVDPGLDPQPIEATLLRLGMAPRAVLCTHGHFDHAGSAFYFQKKYGCPVYMHSQDVKTLHSSNFLLMAMKIPARITPPIIQGIDLNIFQITVGTTNIRFHHSPGHTPGSCILECGNSLFTGDTLYSRGIGLSKLPGQDSVLLRQTLRALFDIFPDNANVRPGHGEGATLGWIKKNNNALIGFLDDRPDQRDTTDAPII
jgi:hydroxyacylglutathione hydrolase